MSVADRSKVVPCDLTETFDSGAVAGLSGLERIDTHMSHVFLGAEHVFKLVRAVRHPFADMRSLVRRKDACEAEFRINKAMAPTLYEGVDQIVVTPEGEYKLGRDGKIVDYVVRMRRFPGGSLFAELADNGLLTSAMIEDAVAALADFHLRQPAERAAMASTSYNDVIADLRSTSSQGTPPDDAADLAASVFFQLAQLHRKLESLVEARRVRGFVRRGHGDFHLKNLCIYEGQVTPFDALSFDDRLATVDLLYDLAFLLMDLRVRGMDAFASLAMNCYFDRLDQDEGALALLPFFMALRASVRMAVAVESRSFEEAISYGRFALSLLGTQPVRLVAIGGLSGTGKSVVARGICHLLPGPAGARILNTDVIRKQDAGVGTLQPMPSQAYTADDRHAVYEELARRAPIALEAGTSIIADGTYYDSSTRCEIASAAGEHPFCGIWLQTETARRLERVRARRNNVSDASVQIAARQEEPIRLEAGWQRVDANGDAPIVIDLVASLLNDSELAN